MEHVLSVLSDIDGAAFEALSRKFRVYASCVGAADTAYFRRRRLPVLRRTQGSSADLSEDDPDGAAQRWRRRDDDDERMLERLESLMVDPTALTRSDR